MRVRARIRSELLKPGRSWALLVVLWIVTALFVSWIFAAICVGGTVVLGLVKLWRRRSRIVS
jgi:hypothetical protein